MGLLLLSCFLSFLLFDRTGVHEQHCPHRLILWIPHSLFPSPFSLTSLGKENFFFNSLSKRTAIKSSRFIQVLFKHWFMISLCFSLVQETHSSSRRFLHSFQQNKFSLFFCVLFSASKGFYVVYRFLPIAFMILPSCRNLPCTREITRSASQSCSVKKKMWSERKRQKEQYTQLEVLEGHLRMKTGREQLFEGDLRGNFTDTKWPDIPSRVWQADAQNQRQTVFFFKPGWCPSRQTGFESAFCWKWRCPAKEGFPDDHVEQGSQ